MSATAMLKYLPSGMGMNGNIPFINNSSTCGVPGPLDGSSSSSSIGTLNHPSIFVYEFDNGPPRNIPLSQELVEIRAILVVSLECIVAVCSPDKGEEWVVGEMAAGVGKVDLPWNRFD